MQLKRIAYVMSIIGIWGTGWLGGADVVIAPVVHTVRPTVGERAATGSIAEALAAVTDEDAGTRAAGLARLEACTESDRADLERALKNQDLMIRGHAELILAKLNRGEVAVQVTFADGKPAAGLKFEVRLTRQMVASRDDASAALRECRKTVEPPGAPVLNGSFTSDAQGKLAIGRFVDGRYYLAVSTADEVPVQYLTKDLELRRGAKPIDWQIKHGITVRVKVVDSASRPVAGARVGVLPSEKDQEEFAHRKAADGERQLHGLVGGETNPAGGVQWTAIGPMAAVGVALQGYRVVTIKPPELKDGAAWEWTATLIAVDGAEVDSQPATDVVERIRCPPATAVAHPAR